MQEMGGHLGEGPPIFHKPTVVAHNMAAAQGCIEHRGLCTQPPRSLNAYVLRDHNSSRHWPRDLVVVDNTDAPDIAVDAEPLPIV
jgi:hypothetical protein